MDALLLSYTMPDGPDEISIGELEDGGISFDSELDEQAEELLELEAKLSSIPGAEMDPDEQYESGMVVGAERVQVTDVPNTYPALFRSPNTLRLDVQLAPDRQTSVFLDWPEQLTGDTPLDQLLSIIDLPAHSFADILGREIPIKRDESHYVVALDDVSTVDDRNTTVERSTTDSMAVSDTDSNLPSPYWHYIVVSCVISWMTVWIALNNITAGLALIVQGVFPVAIYFDSKYVRARSTWSPHKWVWPVLSFIWLINIPAGIVYLAKRNQANVSDV